MSEPSNCNVQISIKLHERAGVLDGDGDEVARPLNLVCTNASNVCVRVFGGCGCACRSVNRTLLDKIRSIGFECTTCPRQVRRSVISFGSNFHVIFISSTLQDSQKQRGEGERESIRLSFFTFGPLVIVRTRVKEFFANKQIRQK